MKSRDRLRSGRGARIKVTEAAFTFVALDDDGRPRPFAVDGSFGGG